MARYVLDDYIFSPTETGGLEIFVGPNAPHALHMSEEELFEMLSTVGLTADFAPADEPELDESEIDKIEHEDHEF